jgi:UDP-N-acetylmuramoylalanine--D-glutamate ligase
VSIHELDHKEVCILGYGREGRSTYKALKHFAPHARITIADLNPTLSDAPNVPRISGPDYLTKLSEFDVIIKTPGIPWHPPIKITSRVTSATELFLCSLPPGARTIGVTGTKGKSTTANLIYQVLDAAGKRAVLAGNIGEPMLDHLRSATSTTIFVLELSSYQLETLHTSPDTAVITSFFPDHLDYHGSLSDYFNAKSQITRYQKDTDIVFYNGSSLECRQLAEIGHSKRVPYSGSDFPGTPQKAFDNTAGRSNLAAAFLVGRHFGVSTEIAINILEHASSLPHRQQIIGTRAGITWIDDSAATTPQSTIAALDSLKGNLETIIVGGMNRSYDFSQLGKALAESNVANVILFPDTGNEIRQAIESAQPSRLISYFETSDMNEAVEFAHQHSKPGSTCLLSSGSPSYNLFKNYFERGEAFTKAVLRIRP